MSSEVPVVSLYFPASQEVQKVAPAGEYSPAEQVVHEEEPELELYFPLSQATHAELSVLLSVPAPQVVQSQETTRLKPLRHSPPSKGQLVPQVRQFCRLVLSAVIPEGRCATGIRQARENMLLKLVTEDVFHPEIS